jgi:hypothetical protein
LFLFNVGGHRANENSYRVNGVSINDYSNSAPGGATGSNLGVDAIQEFSVLTSNYTAEYGRTSGAVINAITKSGSNDFHGTGYFFDRDAIFDARNFFDGPQIPPFRRIQFGASGGTAIVKDKTAVRAGFGIFDVLPLPYEFGLNTAATAPFQIIGADKNTTLGTGTSDPNLAFNRQTIRNRFIDPNPKRADVLNCNINIQREIANGWAALVGYVGSRSVHLSVASDDINLVQPTYFSEVGFVYPCDPSQIVPYTAINNCSNNQTGTRIDSNWGGGAGIRPVLFDGASSYGAFQSQLKKTTSRGVEGQVSYTFGKCRDTSSAPVTGDTYLNSIAVPLLLIKSARVGACVFDIRQTLTASVIWDLPGPKSGVAGFVGGGWQLGTIVTASTGALFTVTAGNGNDPLGTGFNGDFTANFATLLPGCNPIHGGVNYLNAACFIAPTAPASLGPATAANPYGCAPLSYTSSPVSAPSGQQFCSNVLGNTGRNKFYGPGLTTVDFSVFKNTHIPKISETFNVQFRAEFFNILNHTNFLSPGFLNTFGQNNSAYDFNGSSLPTALNQTSTTSRQIQLGLKLIW